MIALVALVFGFASGVFFRSLFFFPSGAIWFLLFIAAFLCGAFFHIQKRLLLIGCVFVFMFVLGILRASVADAPLPESFAHDLGSRVSYTGIVVSDPDVREHNTRFVVATKKASSTRILIVAQNASVKVGDRVFVQGTLTLPAPFASDEEAGRIFRYDGYLEKDGIRFLIPYASVSKIAPAPWYSFRAFFSSTKHLFLNGLQKGMPEPFASLAGGVVLGGKRALPEALSNAFVVSGLIPVVVLSGYNVMVVAEGVLYALSFLRLRRRWQMLGAAVALLLFVAIAGVSSTALRASLMALIALYARATSRTYEAGRALLVTVLGLLVVNPLLLVFDPGFELSVAATAGIIWLSPLFEAKLGSTKTFLKSLLATSFAAQLGVLPLLLYQTGRLSLVAIPANLLVLPFVPLLMASAAIAAVVGAVLPALAVVVSIPAYLLSAYVIEIATRAASLPLASVSLPQFSFWYVGVAYAALIFAASSKRFSTTDQFTFWRKAST